MRFKTFAAALIAFACFAVPASAEFTVVEHEKLTDGGTLAVACDQTVTKSYPLPNGAQNVKVLTPHAGDAVKDGFGRDRLGTIDSVDVDNDSIDITVTGGYVACTYPGEWDANPTYIRATYDRVLHPKILVSEEPGGLDARQEPEQITATADAGWKRMHWKNWGERIAVAKGKFYGVRAVDPTGTDAELKTFTYPVEVTLSKPRLCGDNYYYSHLETRFLRKPNPEIAKQAKVPGVAGCLNGG